MSTNLQQKTTSLSRWTIPELMLLSLALLSLVYAVVTRRARALISDSFRLARGNGLMEYFRSGEGVIGVYTPFLLPLFSPIAFFVVRDSHCSVACAQYRGHNAEPELCDKAMGKAVDLQNEAPVLQLSLSRLLHSALLCATGKSG